MNSFITLALMVASTIAIPAPTLKAISAISQYPGAALLGSSIEGASCDKSGKIYAVNQTEVIDLSDGSAKPLLCGVGGTTSHYSSSRFTKEHGILIGDAVAHKVVTTNGKQILYNNNMLQPNDMTVNGPETYVYLSGMNYKANTGDLWMLNTKTGVAESCELPHGQIYRTNGIELSPDDSTLYLTSAENSPDGKSVVSAKVWKFTIDKSTGKPSNPTIAIDLYTTLITMGLDPKTASMDPDGMRMDSSGTLFVTLNAFQKVLKWDTNKPCNTAKVIDLETVKYPSNCEFGGPEGKDLVIVGRCADEKSSCVDIYKHSVPGRAYTNLNTGGSLPPKYDAPSAPKPADGPKNPSYGTPNDNPKPSKPPTDSKHTTYSIPDKTESDDTYNPSPAPSHGNSPPPPMDYNSGNKDRSRSVIQDYFQKHPDVSEQVKKACGKTNPTMDDMINYIMLKNGDKKDGDHSYNGNDQTKGAARPQTDNSPKNSYMGAAPPQTDNSPKNQYNGSYPTPKHDAPSPPIPAYGPKNPSTPSYGTPPKDNQTTANSPSDTNPPTYNPPAKTDNQKTPNTSPKVPPAYSAPEDPATSPDNKATLQNPPPAYNGKSPNPTY